MKKVYALLVLFAICATAANAQSKFHFGLKISPSLLWLKTEPVDADKQKIENDGAKFGFAYGVFGDYYFAENYAFNAELRINHLGAAYTYMPTGNDTFSINRNLTLQYIEIPVTLKMRTNEIGYMRYFGQFGFMPSINIKAKGDVSTKIHSGKTEKSDLNLSGNVNPLGAYLVIGAGAEYNLGGTTSLLGGITFHNGFTNLWNKDDDDGSIGNYLGYNNFNVKPAYVSLNLGVVF